jgi:hypothetical protein
LGVDLLDLGVLFLFSCKQGRKIAGEHLRILTAVPAVMKYSNSN